MKPANLFNALPKHPATEIFDDLVRSSTVRIERIVSKGHRSPETGWYDQDEHEWVIVMQGKATLAFDDGSVCHLSEGDYINIPAHTKHKVSWTDPDNLTVWLAVFYT